MLTVNGVLRWGVDMQLERREQVSLSVSLSQLHHSVIEIDLDSVLLEEYFKLVVVIVLVVPEVTIHTVSWPCSSLGEINWTLFQACAAEWVL